MKLLLVARDESLTKERLNKYCREQLTLYKVPRQIEIRDVFPMTPIGKIRRKDLRVEEMGQRENA